MGAVLVSKEKAQVFNLNTLDSTQHRSIEVIGLLQRFPGRIELALSKSDLNQQKSQPADQAITGERRRAMMSIESKEMHTS